MNEYTLYWYLIYTYGVGKPALLSSTDIREKIGCRHWRTLAKARKGLIEKGLLEYKNRGRSLRGEYTILRAL